MTVPNGQWFLCIVWWHHRGHPCCRKVRQSIMYSFKEYIFTCLRVAFANPLVLSNWLKAFLKIFKIFFLITSTFNWRALFNQTQLKRVCSQNSVEKVSLIRYLNQESLPNVLYLMFHWQSRSSQSEHDKLWLVYQNVSTNYNLCWRNISLGFFL